jgi:cytochrome c-type biogenesis protein CcmH
MTLWIIFAVMTAAAVFVVLWPLGHKPRAVEGGSDRLVYQDQLREIDRDRAAGMIGEAEAESARIEISRRLLAAAAEETSLASATPQAQRHRRAAALAAIVVIPAIALGFYVYLGSPDVPGQPAFARSSGPQNAQSIASLISQVEEHLARDPNDGAGWEVIAPVYLRMGRFDDAVMARRKAIVLNGDTPAREADLGEALVAAANGVVTDEAKHALTLAAADSNEIKARYFLGLADEQDGNRDAAAAKWRAMLDGAPPGAPWANFVRSALARVTGSPVAGPGSAGQNTASGPSAGDMAAADTMDPAQRNEMIRGMVQRLADRLHSDGSDVEGWLRLVRAYTVLGDRDKAKGAAADAKRALAVNPDAVKQIDDLVKGLGLEG